MYYQVSKWTKLPRTLALEVMRKSDCGAIFLTCFHMVLSCGLGGIYKAIVVLRILSHEALEHHLPSNPATFFSPEFTKFRSVSIPRYMNPNDKKQKIVNWYQTLKEPRW